MPKKGYQRTEEHNKNLSKSLKEYHSKPENRNRTVAPLLNPDSKELSRQGRIKYFETHDAHNKGIRHTKQTRDKMRKSMLQLWKDRRDKKNRK